jgi:hypothetical protein
MSLAELLREPDRLAFLLLCGLVLLTLLVGAVQARRGRARRAASAEADEPVTTWPFLVRLELVAALATLLVVSWWAIALPLSLGPPADPTVTPADAKAPWFFVGVQELLQYFDPWLGGVVLPGLSLLGLALLPYLDRRAPEDAGRYALRPGALLALGALCGLWLLPSAVGLFLRGENWSFAPLWRPPPVLDEPMPAVLGSLGERLHLGAVGAQLLGAGLCLAPILLLPLLWAILRRRRAGVGLGRFLIVGTLVVLLFGVAAKVALVAGLRVRYLWVTPWFRI